MQNSSAATRQPISFLHYKVKRIKVFFPYRPAVFMPFTLENQSSTLDKSKHFKILMKQDFPYCYFKKSLCLSVATSCNYSFEVAFQFQYNCDESQKWSQTEFLYCCPEPWTPAWIWFICLKPQDKCLLANQTLLGMIVSSLRVVWLYAWSLKFTHWFLPEQRSHLKRECTSLVCAIFPGCTWSKSSWPSPTPMV